MNYQIIYEALVLKRKNLPATGYFEKHHIIPKCMGGTNEPSNFVKLTAREHFLAHLLLAKIHGGTLWGAVNRMLNSKVHNSKEYAWARKQFSISIKGSGNGRYGLPVSEKTRKLIGEANMGRPRSQYEKDLSSKLHKGRVRSPENRLKVSLSKNSKPFKVFKVTIHGNKKTGISYEKGECVGTWQIIRECARQLKMCHSSIRACLFGKAKFRKGYMFEWI